MLFTCALRTLSIAILFIAKIHGRNEAQNKTDDSSLSNRWNLFAAWDPTDHTSCTSGRFEPGICRPLRDCSALLNKVRHLHSGRIFEALQDYTYPCSIRGHVCCPSEKKKTDSGLGRDNRKTTQLHWPGWRPPITPHPTQPPTTTRTTKLTTTNPPRTPKPKKTGSKDKCLTFGKYCRNIFGACFFFHPFRGLLACQKIVPSSNGNKTKHKNRGLLHDGNCGVSLVHRVIGGEETGIQEHPWMALLRMKFRSGKTAFVCGGTLISPRYVLTAAHCLKGAGVPRGAIIDIARLGEHNVQTSKDCTSHGDCSEVVAQDITVEQSIIHPDFTPNDAGTFNDIALLRLSREVTFNVYVQQACLPLDGLSNSQYDGKKLTTIGWGRTSNEDPKNSPVKRKVDVPVVTFSQCYPQYKARNIILRDTQICAGGEEKKDSCQGDSGGPLLSLDRDRGEERWHIQGIVSTGPKDCGTKGQPALYTRVNKYLTWILDNIRD